MASNNQLPPAEDNPKPEDIEANQSSSLEEVLSKTSELSLEEVVSEGDRPHNQVVTYHKSIPDGKYVPVILSLGFRFQPDDCEVMEYLNRKIRNETASCNLIPSVNIYKHTPDELAGLHPSLGKGEWYYFTTRDRKYANGIRPNRAAGGIGYWKATGPSADVYRNGVIIGTKRSLDFHEGKPPEGRKTEWTMLEFVSEQPQRERTSPDDMRLDDCVLCRIQRKPEYKSPETKEAGQKSCEKKKQRKRRRVETEQSGTSHDNPLASDQLVLENPPSDLCTGPHSFVSDQHQSFPPPQQPPILQEPELHPPERQQSLPNPQPEYLTWGQLGGLHWPQQQARLGARAWQQHVPQQRQSLQKPQQYFRGQQPGLEAPMHYLRGQQSILQMPQQEPGLQVPQQPNLQNPLQYLSQPQPFLQVTHQEPGLQVPQQSNFQNQLQYLPGPQSFLQMPRQQPRTHMLHQNLQWQHSGFPTSVGQHHLDSVQYSQQAEIQGLDGMLDRQPEIFPKDFSQKCFHQTGNDFTETVSRIPLHEADDFDMTGGFDPDSLFNFDYHPQHEP